MVNSCIIFPHLSHWHPTPGFPWPMGLHMFNEALTYLAFVHYIIYFCNLIITYCCNNSSSYLTNVYVSVIVTKVIVRVHLVHLMNGD